MSRSQSKASLVNKDFLYRVKPIMESWGLKKHPNPISYSGKSEHGFRYDFVDNKNEFDIKIAAFSILSTGPSLWIKGLRQKKKYVKESEIPIIFDSMSGVFTLTKKWSFTDPFNVRFEFIKRGAQSDEEAASKLIDSVLTELPKLKYFLYA